MADDITEDHDHGSVWQLIYCDDDGREQLLHFEHRPFSYFYKSATGRNFTRMTASALVSSASPQNWSDNK